MIDTTNVIIDAFNLQMFRAFVEQNLMADNQIIIRFDMDMVKSVAMTRSESYIKMWQSPLSNFKYVEKEENTEVIDFDAEDNNPDIVTFDPFDVFVLKGDIFKRYLSVFSQDPVTLEFTINNREGKINQAAKLKITGKSILGSRLETTFTLTSEEMIINKVEDYGKITAKMTPEENAASFILSIDDIQEIKRLVKDLHKTNPENSSYLQFNIDVSKGTVTVSDRVFDITFLLNNYNDVNAPKENLEFRILKSDFVVTGNHSYTFYYNPGFVIINSNYKKCIISGMIGTIETETKTDDPFQSSIAGDDISDAVDVSDLDEYFK